MFCNATELLLVIYLWIIWISDFILQEDIVIKNKIWRSGIACFAAFYLIILYAIQSQTVLLFLTTSRLKVVLSPIKTKFKQTKFVSKYLGGFTFVNTLISLLVTLMAKYFFVRMVPISLCLPFVDPTNSVMILKILTWFVVLTQTCTSVVILILNYMLVKSLFKSQEVRKCSKRFSRSSLQLIVQLMVITTSNIMCWFPANIIYVSAMFMERYPSSLIIWSTIISMPLNSIINPIVFMIIALKKILKGIK